MFNRLPIGGKLSVGDVVKVLEKRFPYVEVSSVLGADSSYDSNRKVRKDEYDGAARDVTLISVFWTEGEFNLRFPWCLTDREAE